MKKYCSSSVLKRLYGIWGFYIFYKLWIVLRKFVINLFVTDKTRVADL